MIALLLQRLAAGAFLIFLGVIQVKYGNPEYFGFTLFSIATKGALPLVQVYLRDYLIPNPQIAYYTLLSFYFVTGGLLVLGFMTRIASLLLLCFGLIALSSMFHFGAVYQMMGIACVVLGFGYLINSPGKIMGLDAWFGRKKTAEEPTPPSY